MSALHCRVAAIVVVMVIALGELACAHTIEVRSEPPGADVYVEGEHVGVTPLALERTTSHEDVIAVTVQQDGREARLAVRQDGWAFEPILAGFGAMGAAALLGVVMVGVGYVTILAAALVVPTVGATAIAFLLGGAALAYGGIFVATFAGYLPFIALGELGRVGPDEVFVDFRRGRVSTSPPGRADPLIGVSEGFTPLRWDPRARDDEPASPR